MRCILLVAALAISGCRSTRQAIVKDYDVKVEERVEVEDKTSKATLTTSQKDVIMFVEEIVERIEEPTDSIVPPKITERRTKRSVAVDRSTLQEFVSEKKDIDSTSVTKKADKTTTAIEVEVEDSTPRNLRWIGILGISLAVIAICIVILRLKK